MGKVIAIKAGIRSHSEIKEELSRLSKIPKHLIAFSKPEMLWSAEINVECVKAQMRVLRERMTYDDIDDAFESAYVASAACTALEWMNGDDSLAEKYGLELNESPSDVWLRLLVA